MLNHTKRSLLDLLKAYGGSNYSGQTTCESKRGQLILWFVRGHLVHAHSQSAGDGWDALKTAATEAIEVTAESPESLPPERSIRVSLSRLIKSLEEEHRSVNHDRMYIPIPLHAQLLLKFKELQKRVRGLSDIQAYSIAGSDDGLECRSNADKSGSESSERILIELGPRGATWTHYANGEEVSLKGDSTLTTSELMRAGEELISELRVMRQRGADK